ncbi:hypothetical protein [Cryobacterium sp. Y57]|uniref:hypothetical protein n=1 Tax=Cryobacterium sp. Y57 TaxID=2048287 RepID=UPI000CE388E7|nr:hypothetical protein [Cryobacterium sp. Y57]
MMPVAPGRDVVRYPVAAGHKVQRWFLKFSEADEFAQPKGLDVFFIDALKVIHRCERLPYEINFEQKRKPHDQHGQRADG